MNNKEFIGKLASRLADENKNNNESFLTGETNLKLTIEELEERLLRLKHGKSYLGVLRVEGSLLELQGLIEAKLEKFENENFEVVYEIPDWDKFISGVHAFHDVCGPY